MFIVPKMYILARVVEEHEKRVFSETVGHARQTRTRIIMVILAIRSRFPTYGLRDVFFYYFFLKS